MTVYRVPMTRTLHLTVTVDAPDPTTAQRAAELVAMDCPSVYPYYPEVEYGRVQTAAGEPEAAS